MTQRILITPMDWGLGHATRCIPIIRVLLKMDHDVWLGGSGNSLALLQKEFPQLNYIELPAYDPTYPGGRSMVWSMVAQLPNFFVTIQREHGVVDRFVQENKIDLIISDNRYGCWSYKTRSVLITHQSNILMPKRFGWLGSAVSRTLDSFLRHFDFCWIPDVADDSLAGDLISFGKLNYNGKVDYIGALSRFHPPLEPVATVYDILAICSGPEPQRSLLEELLSTALKNCGKKFLLIRGVVNDINGGDHINYMTSDELQRALWQSSLIISRSGYSTIMDLSILGKKAIFIPTPGQTEQEYLAKRLKQKGIAFFMEQDQFDLSLALKEAQLYYGFDAKSKPDLLTPALLRVLKS
jgi:predicted glycosyltransferase